MGPFLEYKVVPVKHFPRGRGTLSGKLTAVLQLKYFPQFVTFKIKDHFLQLSFFFFHFVGLLFFVKLFFKPVSARKKKSVTSVLLVVAENSHIYLKTWPNKTKTVCMDRFC